MFRTKKKRRQIISGWYGQPAWLRTSIIDGFAETKVELDSAEKAAAEKAARDSKAKAARKAEVDERGT